MLLLVFVVLCPVLKELSASDRASLLTLWQLCEMEPNAAAGSCSSPHLAGEHWPGLGWAGLDSVLGKHIFSPWQFLAAFMCSFLACIIMG